MPRSNKKWCGHPMSHEGTKKSGPGALRPHGDRPIHHDLAAFITHEYYQVNANVGFSLSKGDLLCRTCYKAESTRFHSSLFEEGNSIAVDSPISAGSRHMAETVETKYKLEQHKELLNQVFQVLGIEKIRNVRLTNQVDKQVTIAIELIRSAAEALQRSENITQPSSHSLFKLADKEYLLDSVKFLINSSDRHEQIRLLTLATPEWGRTKVEEYFECSCYLAQKSISLRDSYGKLAVPVDWRGNTCLDPHIVQKIIDFYSDDVISHQSPNKRNVIHVQKNPVAVRHMSMTIGQAYQLFVQQLQANQSLSSVQKSSFYNLRPKWIKVKKPHDVCTCIYHENFELLIQLMSTNRPQLQRSQMQRVGGSIHDLLEEFDVNDHLDHNIDFVHAAQSVIVQFIRHRYSTVKRVNYITDGAPQHFKSNKSMLNLTYHESDFGIPAAWTFSATAHGKGLIDGIRTALKYRATRRVLTREVSEVSTRFTAHILTISRP
ncbi:unnamed protein product [Adineta ricciae]|uniref:Uncharacterized protein n=1 Tax=Adineta ricciae TaxID=249248 RepID=A0A815WCJ9_ADIRI|nr:unnamed protein product [Adineta ricciae]